MASNIGINKSVAKKTVKELETHLNNLGEAMQKLSSDVERMNEFWYGDKYSFRWYRLICNYYNSKEKKFNLVNYRKSIKNFKQKLDDFCKRSSSESSSGYIVWEEDGIVWD